MYMYVYIYIKYMNEYITTLFNKYTLHLYKQ